MKLHHIDKQRHFYVQGPSTHVFKAQSPSSSVLKPSVFLPRRSKLEASDSVADQSEKAKGRGRVISVKMETYTRGCRVGPIRTACDALR